MLLSRLLLRPIAVCHYCQVLNHRSVLYCSSSSSDSYSQPSSSLNNIQSHIQHLQSLDNKNIFPSSHSVQNLNTKNPSNDRNKNKTSNNNFERRRRKKTSPSNFKFKEKKNLINDGKDKYHQQRMEVSKNIQPHELLNEMKQKLPKELKNAFMKYSENSIPSIPIQHQKYSNKKPTKNDDELEWDAIQFKQEQNELHFKENISLKAIQDSNIEIMVDYNSKNSNLYDQIQSKKRDKLHAKRQHFYIKDGNSNFSNIAVNDLLVKRLHDLGYKCPSVIQSLFIKEYHSTENTSKSTFVIGSETGSGKTLAYLIPVIDELIEHFIKLDVLQVKKTMDEYKNCRISMDDKKCLDQRPFLNYPKCVIIEPTSELCAQVRSVCQSLCKPFGIRVQAWSERHSPPNIKCIEKYQRKENKVPFIDYESAPEILIVTPSVFKYVFDAKFCLRISHLVFDEADIMLTHVGGKWTHIRRILSVINEYQKDCLLDVGRKSVLNLFPSTTYIFVGATLCNKRVKVFLGQTGARSKKQSQTALPERLMRLFQKARWIVSPNVHRHSLNLKQKWVFVRDHLEQQELLLRHLHRHPAQKNRYKIMQQSFPPLDQCIIFCNSKTSVEDCVKFCNVFFRFLKKHRIPSIGLHEKMEDEIKDKALLMFESKAVPILVSSDIVTRGIDFNTNVELIIQLDFARTTDIHYNRVGRTARAGIQGFAVNFYMSDSIPIVKQLMNISQNNERIDCMFKSKPVQNKISKKRRKEMKKQGLQPKKSLSKISKEMGIQPKTKLREFRFNDGGRNANEEGKYVSKRSKKDSSSGDGEYDFSEEAAILDQHFVMDKTF